MDASIINRFLSHLVFSFNIPLGRVQGNNDSITQQGSQTRVPATSTHSALHSKPRVNDTNNINTNHLPLLLHQLQYNYTSIPVYKHVWCVCAYVRACMQISAVPVHSF
jgi:hypothetical protein